VSVPEHKTPPPTLTGFIVARHQQDQNNRLQLRYWVKHDDGVSLITLDHQEAVLFVRTEDWPRIHPLIKSVTGWRSAELNLTDLEYRPVTAVYAHSLQVQRAIIDTLTRHQIPMMEEDIRPVDRYLMERFIFGAVSVWLYPGLAPRLKSASYKPSFRVLSFDLETTMRADQIHSIGCYLTDFSPEDGLEPEGDPVGLVFMRGEGRNTDQIAYFPDERSLLKAWVAWVTLHDPDLLMGWNVVGFDCKVLAQRAEALKVPLAIGRDQQPMQVIQSGQGKWYARIEGRAVLDGIDVLKNATYHFESYSLESVSQSLFGQGKLIHNPDDRGAEIQRLYREDKEALARYNLEDCRLVWAIFQETKLLEYLTERTRLTGLPLDKVGGSAASFDFQYLPRLHRSGYVAPQYASGQSGLNAPGGFVMESQPGLYEHVLVLDFKSLYPSIIRTFKVDPYGLAEGLKEGTDVEACVMGYHGARYHIESAILPTIIEELWAARDQAKARKNASLSQAIKIIMNSFYGVLGSDVCRFFDQRLSGSITLRGHQILQTTRDQIEAVFGYSVIYGDTDSVFVLLGEQFTDESAQAEGQKLALYLNDWWAKEINTKHGVPSFLEIEYETHYSRFVMPRMRHSEKGSKKRYAGLLKGPNGEESIVFKGLENVRSDWTALARELQNKLYSAVFHDQDYQEEIIALIDDLNAGLLDDQLVYRRKLRRPLASYDKVRPPHVQAALKAEQRREQAGLLPFYTSGSAVEYVITVHGAEPYEYRQSPIDYQHYIDKQIRPVVDGIVCFKGETLADWIEPQSDLFETQ
jgi:DNA polymerase-2